MIASELQTNNSQGLRETCISFSKHLTFWKYYAHLYTFQIKNLCLTNGIKISTCAHYSVISFASRPRSLCDWPRKQQGPQVTSAQGQILLTLLVTISQTHAWDTLESLPASITGTCKFCSGSKSLNLDAFQDELWMIFVTKTSKELEGTLLFIH